MPASSAAPTGYQLNGLIERVTFFSEESGFCERLCCGAISDASAHRILSKYICTCSTGDNMKRTDLKIERGKITIHPRKLEAMKREARARIGSDGRATLRDAVLDEELESFVDLLMVQEIEDEMRSEIRSMLAEGLQ
jgi:hypothetical protein